MKRVFSILMVFLVAITSCNTSTPSKNCYYTCHSAPAIMYFLNYTIDSLDTMYLRVFTHDNTFSNLLETDSFYSPIIFARLGDTGLSYNTMINTDKDYEVILKKTHETFRIHPSDSLAVIEEVCGRTTPCYTSFARANITNKTFKILQAELYTSYLDIYKN